MSHLEEKQVVTALINEFAEALNTPASTSPVSSFYTSDGLFFPNNHPTLNKDQLKKAKGKFLKNRKFTIHFEIGEVVIQEGFAFVNATAKTTITELGKPSYISTSRDLFVLREEAGSWKIYRYMFNESKNG